MVARVVIALALLALPAAAHAAPRMEVGAQAGARGLPQLVEAKVSWVRATVHMGTRWGALDELVDNATAHGVQVELVLTGPARAPRSAPFRRFVTAVARHFKGRVSRYAMWDEPNRTLEPRVYRALYRAGYAAVKKVSKDTEVLFGETAPRDALKFMRAVACAGCEPLRAEGVGYHTGDVTRGSLARLTSALHRLARTHSLVARGGVAPPLYLTRTGTGHVARAFETAQRDPHVHQLVQRSLPQATFAALKKWATAAARAGRITTPKAP